MDFFLKLSLITSPTAILFGTLLLLLPSVVLVVSLSSLRVVEIILPDEDGRIVTATMLLGGELLPPVEVFVFEEGRRLGTDDVDEENGEEVGGVVIVGIVVEIIVVDDGTESLLSTTEDEDG
jgi:hypothetical protein